MIIVDESQKATDILEKFVQEHERHALVTSKNTPLGSECGSSALGLKQQYICMCEAKTKFLLFFPLLFSFDLVLLRDIEGQEGKESEKMDGRDKSKIEERSTKRI